MSPNRLVSIKQDVLFLWVAGTTALCLGLLINQFRDAPLPLTYQDKAERLQLAVERLAPAPTQVAGSATAEDLPEFLSLKEFAAIVETGGGVVLDARPEIFHRLGHVPGTFSLPRDDFENAYTGLRERLEADKSQTIVLYCSSSACEDSELVKRSLVALGYTRIAIFKGGWSEWKAANKPEKSGL